MNERFQFTLVEIMPQKEFLKLTPEERLEQNDLMANRLIVLEEFINKLFQGWNFIQLQHGYHR